MHRPDPNDFHAAPLNPLPWVVWLLALPLIAIEAAIALGQSGLAGGAGAIGWRQMAYQRFAFVPDYLRAMWDSGIYPPELLARFVTYPFIHGSFTHALMVLVFILALGKMVGELFRAPAVLAVFFGSGIAGALAYAALPVAVPPLYGGYPAVFGLVGAFTYVLWARLGVLNANRARAFTLIGLLMGIRLLFGVLFGGNWDWVAELVGFAAGFGLSALVAPGGVARLMLLMRRR